MFSVKYYTKFNDYFIGFIGFDIDPSAITLSAENAIDHNMSDRCDFILCDTKNIEKYVKPKTFDTVIMNPPFGTRQKGIDLTFLKMALHMSSTAVYSLHKTSTRNFVIDSAKKMGIYSKVIAELRFDLPASYKFHKYDSLDVKVDLIRFVVPATLSNR